MKVKNIKQRSVAEREVEAAKQTTCGLVCLHKAKVVNRVDLMKIRKSTEGGFEYVRKSFTQAACNPDVEAVGNKDGFGESPRKRGR